MDKEWSYVFENDNHFTAPVWLSEFGGHYYETRPLQQAWLTRFVDYLIEKDVSFAWWQLRYGPMGLVTEDYSQRKTDDYRLNDVTRLLAYDGLSGAVPASDKYTQLHPMRGDYNLSQSFPDHRLESGPAKSGLSRRPAPGGHRGRPPFTMHERSVRRSVERRQRVHRRRPGRDPGRFSVGARARVQYQCEPGFYVAGFSTSGQLRHRRKRCAL